MEATNSTEALNMPEHSQGIRAAIEGSARLLETSEYTDLAFHVEGQDIPVHRAVVCPRSKVFAIECDGRFREAKTGKIEIGAPSADLETIRRMVEYIYVHHYDDERLSKMSRVGPPHVTSVEEKSLDTTAETDLVAAPMIGEEAKSTPQHSSTEPAQARGVDLGSPEGVDMIISALINNARVYACGHFYDIEDLKEHAAKKFDEVLSMVEGAYHAQFAEVVEQVYEFLPVDDRLRATVLAHTIKLRDVFGKNAAFLEAVRMSPDFIVDFTIGSMHFDQKEKAAMQFEINHWTNQADTGRRDMERAQGVIEDLRRSSEQSRGILDALNDLRVCRKCQRQAQAHVTQSQYADWELLCVRCLGSFRWR